MPSKKKKQAGAPRRHVYFEDDKAPSREAKSLLLGDKSLVESITHRRGKRLAIARELKTTKTVEAVSGPAAKTFGTEINKENEAENSADPKVELELQSDEVNEEMTEKEPEAVEASSKTDTKGAAKRGGKRAKKTEEEKEQVVAAVEEVKPEDEDAEAKAEKKPAAKRGKRGAKKMVEEEPEKAVDADEEQAEAEDVKPEKTKRGGKRAAKKPEEEVPAEEDKQEADDAAMEVEQAPSKPEKAVTKRGGRRGAKKADETPAEEEKVEDAAMEVEPPSKPVAKRGAKRGAAKKADEVPAEVDEQDKAEDAAVETEEVVAPSKPVTKRGGRRGAANKADEAQTGVEEAVPEEPSEPKAANGSDAGPKKRGGKKREPEKTQESEPGQNSDLTGPDEKKTKPNETEEESYECSRENKKGEKWNLKISTWNIAGMRAWVKKNGQDYITKEDPDIICLQETKCPLAKVPADAKIEGYHYYWANSAKDGYAGVAIYTKEKPLNVTNGIESAEHDDEGRVITAEYEKYFLVATYVPNAGQGLKTLPKRMNWDTLFLAYLKSLDAKKPVILCGDLNVAHQEIDLANPKTNKKSAGFTQEERDGMTKMLSEGFVDSFRQLYPDRAQAYTFWTYMSNARAKNTGWRLDYFILSERLQDSVCDVAIRSKVLGSDHCPVTLFIHV